jgi:ferredoxin-NADP reductase
MDQPVAPGGRLAWQEAPVTAVNELTPRVKSFMLRPPVWQGFRAGQHIDVRLTAPDGYMAERSYSIGSAPESPEVELIVERLTDGEVSPFFHEVVQAGDTIEMRGPIGGHFTWSKHDGGPLLLVGGGSGMVPLLSILRHRAAVAPDVPATLIYSARGRDELIYNRELMDRAATDANFMLMITITRETGLEKPYRMGRIGAELVSDVIMGFGQMPSISFVCGSSAFVDSATRLLLDMGVPFPSIKTERYGGDPARDGAPGGKPGP